MTFDDYAIFDLLVQRAGEQTYQARVVGSLAGQGQIVTFTLPFSQDELRRFLAQSGVAYRKLRLVPEAANPPMTARQFGERLYAAVFAGRVGECFVRSLDSARATGRGLRLCLRLNDVPELAALPWEYLYAPDPAPGFLALSSATPIVRFPELGIEETPLQVTPPLGMLAVVSNPQDVRPLDVEQEYTRLAAALADLQSRGLLRLERLGQPTPDALQARLRSGPDVHIVHFMGHGDFDEQGQVGGLYFENEAGAAHLLTAENLAILLRDHHALRLVFLNACEGARGGRDDFFVGTAQTLIQQGIPSVLAMQFPIGDRAAIALARVFYQALALGMPVDACVSEARKAVKTAGSELEWGTPVLFSRAADARIFVIPTQEQHRQFTRKFEYEPDTVLIRGGPFTMGRAPGDGIPADETPAHPVTMPDFRIGKTPVTNREYFEYVRLAGVSVAPEVGWALAQRGQEPRQGTEDLPVVGVSWDEALAYCRWLSEKTGCVYRLPSEAEWERAASWGPEAAGTGESSIMAGNVWEWTSTQWGRERATADFRYPYRADDGRERLEPQTGRYREWRICRGGSFRDQPLQHASTARNRAAADSRHRTRGFRVVMDLSASH